MKRRICFLAAIFLLLLATPAKADNRIIVRTTLSLQGLQQLCLLQNCSVVGPLGDPLNQVFLITTPLDPAIVLSLLRPLPGIVDAELDQLLSLLGGLNAVTTPPTALSDSAPITYYNSTVWNGYANQPAAQKVRVAAAQSKFLVAGGGIVADIDTGIDPNHPAFAGVLLPGYDFTHNKQGASELNDLSPTDFPSPPPSCPPSTCPPATVNQSTVAILDQSTVAILDTNPKYAAFGHGTMVMGVIHLVAPKANLLPLKAFSSDGTGFLSDILRAIYYAVQNKANVINMSFDFPTSSSELAAALDSANQSALICASSAGNNGQKADPSTGSGMVYPAALQSVVMGVASTSDLDMRSSFSNYGDAIVWVAAPGEGIVTTYPFGTYAAGWGTSFSAPFVSGASALLLNKQAKTNESQAAGAVAHAVPVGPDMGNGRLDVVQALQALSPQDFSLSPTPTTSTVNAGQPATYTLTVTPSGGFNQTVTLGCSGFPPASTCVITPPAVTLDGTKPATASVVVQTMARGVVPPTIPVRIVPFPFAMVVVLAWLLVWVAWLLYVALQQLGEGFRQRPGLAAGLLAVLLCSYSCGGGGSYTSTPTQAPQSSATPSSLTLNPTSVNGGNSSTGKVTLNGPAPSGGTVVALSSSNTSAATVPPNVTVAAGATSAAFQVTTMASAISTPVTISASSGSLAQTASLTVTPQPPPGPTLTSLSLNPTNIVGGSPSSGTVTLSAPAPSGGALVSLSSSNTGVVIVPSNVTISSGATSAIFTASSSSVTASTPVTVSGSYAGVTQTASLTVTPALPPGTPAGTYTLTITGTSGTLSHNTTAKLVVN
jgi:energy-coupling factor transporter transmembrane protein EcfT